MASSAFNLPPALSAPLLALMLWTVCLALGFRAGHVLRIPLARFSLLEKGLVCLALGAGLLQYEPYLLAAFGYLGPSSVLGGVAVLSLLLSWDLWRVTRALLRNLSGLSKWRPGGPWLVWLGVLAPLMGILLARALVINAFGADDDGYHLSAPRRWLAEGTLSYLPTYTNTNASLGFEMLYTIGLATSNTGVKLIHYCTGLFAFGSLLLVARRLGDVRPGVLATSLLLVTSPVCAVPFLFGLGYVDLAAAWLTMMSVVVWLVWRQKPVGANGLLVCMALCVGFAGSFKFTALTVAFAWTPVMVWEARRLRVSWAAIAVAGAKLGLVALLPLLPWMLRSWHLTGNPIFPMLSGVIPTRDWSPETARNFAKFFHYYSWAPGRCSARGNEKPLSRSLSCSSCSAAGARWSRSRILHCGG